ncbi:hypothetical protein CHARACLAT_010526 [Characodon lateralis]|uniref:Uncharacterized protein n=1 Tax=Characodon lateralis TaxID=208331 RepID=A0ABU7D5N0_9TELE|nr:hypothetical protein [Characodon lateralis]
MDLDRDLVVRSGSTEIRMKRGAEKERLKSLREKIEKTQTRRIHKETYHRGEDCNHKVTLLRTPHGTNTNTDLKTNCVMNHSMVCVHSKHGEFISTEKVLH